MLGEKSVLEGFGRLARLHKSHVFFVRGKLAFYGQGDSSRIWKVGGKMVDH